MIGAGISQRPGADVAMEARDVERLGFDFLTITDHLVGGRGSLETWTQLTWAAAATERIRIGTNVLGLPYRPPAVLAKMAETLDRLSGGRLILGLGGGASNDAFRAFGLAVRSPGEKVDALEEAVEIIRRLWTEPGVSVRGEHFRVEDASIEPRPERQIPIWLGVYGRRALGVAARLADGWIPSMPFASPERFVTLRDRLLTAAEEAGRDPGEIILAYNVGVQIQEGRVADERSVAGGVAEVTDRLGDLIQRLGLGALSLWIRGEEQRQRFAEEILPALRR